MKRLVLAVAVAAALAAAGGAATAAPTPTPAPKPAATPSPTPAPTSSTSLDPNTAEVCEKTRTTVIDGIDSFTKEMNNAGTLATNGDLQGAEKSVKQGGTLLLDLSTKLRTQSADAQKPELKQALQDVATELNTLGSGLTGLSSLQNFDTARLEALAQRVSEICGG